MRSEVFFAVFTAFLHTASAARAPPKPAPGSRPASDDVIPGRFIVEFQDQSGLAKRDPNGDHFEQFFRELRGKGIKAKPAYNISSDVFNGASFTAPGAKLEDIQALPEVNQAWPVRRLELPKFTISSVGDDAAKDPKRWTNHARTGVLDLHKKGIRGKGILVGVIDTGTDYRHPALGGGFGKGFKVEGGRDIVGDDYVTGGTYDADSDPMDCNGHGTHVSGIIAGEDESFVGVAPDAKLRSYKVFGCDSSTGDDALIESFVSAYKDGCDIITASVGGPGGWSNAPWPRAATRLARKGVFISIASGNDGEVGSFYSSSGSSARDVVAVGSIDNEVSYATVSQVTLGNEKLNVQYYGNAVRGWDVAGPLPVIPASKDTSVVDDACGPVNANFTGAIALIKRGGCTFEQKEVNAVVAGAEYIWFYNNEEQPITKPHIPVPRSKQFAMISYADGKRIAESSQKAFAEIPSEPKALPNEITGGKMSTYTMWGPTWEAQIKTAVSAPGGKIYSTWLTEAGSYSVISGTSMATPYVAGIAALYMSKYGNRRKLGARGIAELRNRIITSGSAIEWNDGLATDHSRLAPVAQQGSGYVSAAKVIEGSTYVQPSVLELNDTAHYDGRQMLYFRNDGRKAIQVAIEHVPAATFYTFGEGDVTPSVFPPEFSEETAQVSLLIKKFTVRGGATFPIPITIKPPKSLGVDRLPVYSGFIVLSTSTGEKHTVPYQGIHGNLKTPKIWDASFDIPIFSKDSLYGDLFPLPGPTNFTMKDYDRVVVQFFNDWGTPEMRFDIVSEDWKESDFSYPPKKGRNSKYHGSIRTVTGTDYPVYWRPRTNPLPGQFAGFAWNGTLADGTTLKKGTYRINARALRVNGNPRKREDWVSKLSDKIILV